ncbi:MAG: hypothetical protein LBL15_04835 [Oscillospiraceae bacterium]|nr:hypothetical protein [Oscillospiraceae bacterium]
MNMAFLPPELPMGFSMALAKNPRALDSFSKLTAEQKRAVIDQTHRLTSASELRAFVAGLCAE